ncbi:hypothetical protein GCM10022402_08730 [Salinactinospora qingdaonensis]|uniref:Uncharacterized protein n=1 Tax=Salinactinospora qingdaonensis TaxID=702744 RepID=A0ABP7F4M6_9ACTN
MLGDGARPDVSAGGDAGPAARAGSGYVHTAILPGHIAGAAVVVTAVLPSACVDRCRDGAAIGNRSTHYAAESLSCVPTESKVKLHGVTDLSPVRTLAVGRSSP